MKKLILVFAGVSLLSGLMACAQKQTDAAAAQDIKIVDDGHNSRSSLDWGGTYGGIVLGDNSRDIKVKITLNYDGTYSLTKNSGAYNYTGKFKWNGTGSRITLDRDEIPYYYQVGERKLIQLDSEGNAISDKYVLRQTTTN